VATLLVFYVIPKEKIVNLLSKPAESLADGGIRLRWEARRSTNYPQSTTPATVTLLDHPLVGRRVLSGSGAVVEGVVGTRLDLEASESYVGVEKQLNLDPVLKEFEL
jgi:hypothetical protein